MAQCEVKFNFVQWNEKISTCSQSSCQRFIHCGPPLLFSKMWDNKYPAFLTSEPQVVISYSYVMVCCIWWNFLQCKTRCFLMLQWNGGLVRHPARFSALFGLLQVMWLDSHCLMQCSWPPCELAAIETQWSKRGKNGETVKLIHGVLLVLNRALILLDTQTWMNRIRCFLLVMGGLTHFCESLLLNRFNELVKTTDSAVLLRHVTEWFFNQGNFPVFYNHFKPMHFLMF